MTSAEQAVRVRTLALLAADRALAGLVHGVFDGTPPRASPPYVAIGSVEGRDWGTKDPAGRAVRLSLRLVGTDPEGPGAAAVSTEERRVGKEGVSTCRFRGATYPIKKKT